MWKEFSSAVRMFLFLTLVLGLAYPLCMTGGAQLFLSKQANGSLLIIDGTPIGSSLIGQNFTSDEYFHGRPSAAGDDGYDAAGSSGSNLGPTSQKLMEQIQERVQKIREENDLDLEAMVPSDLVTASGSGLDPHISPAAAVLQVKRIAITRGISESRLLALIEKNTEDPQFGFIGEKRVNVLQLNVDLDHSL
jgi:potassium-transporting ATPase KdpC subunit